MRNQCHPRRKLIARDDQSIREAEVEALSKGFENPYSITGLIEEDESKYLEMGFPKEELKNLTPFRRAVLNDIWNSSGGTAKILSGDELDEFGITANEDIDRPLISVYKPSEYPDTSTSQYIKVTSITGLVGSGKWAKSVANALAWSDDWNIVDHMSVNVWWTRNIIGQVTSHAEWGIMIDAVPKTGISYKSVDIPHSNAYSIDSVLEVILKKPKSSSGSMDIVAKGGYTTTSINWGASISYPPGITFTPSDKVFQRANTRNVNDPIK
ncbi:hypothetical protein ABDI30_21470 [Paenibacillus cisolokensis]|uniref:hypothetical protein n=1 Tax=Paenibacillus cisolokensis TaxID=1658519 RepID=UPI003D2AAE31